MTPPVKVRVARQTLLVVCEGDAEISFVRFVKKIYADAGALGRSVQEHNAKGKGGKHVLETALRRARNNRDYDKVILLLDTDTAWSDADRAKARKARIGKRGRVDVIESAPCLEAWLLQILGDVVEGDTQYMKRKFKAYTGFEAHEPGWMKGIDRNALDEARERVLQLAELMNHMGIAKR